MRVLILEDDVNRVERFKEKLVGHELFITQFPKVANRWLEEQEFDFIFLDHDLEEESQGTDNNFDVGTGLEVANFLGRKPYLSTNAQIIVHSLNSGGSTRMIQAMGGRNAIQYPFTVLIDNIIIR